MNAEDDETDRTRDRAAEPAARGGKKPYQKPSFRYERVFETSALACGKISATQAQCLFNRSSS